MTKPGTGRRRPSSRKLILTYHSLDSTGSVISVDPAAFRRQMEFLAASSTPVVALEDLPRVPSGIALTFDDAFLNFYEHAAPVLAALRIPATVFVVSGYCGKRNDWPSQPASGIPLLNLMSWSQIREIQRAGITIGAHTVTHPRLSRIPFESAAAEVFRCREEIQQQTGAPVRTFCYPYGDLTAKVRECVAQHFRVACGTALSGLHPDSDPHNLPRVDAYYVRKQFWFESLWTRGGSAYLAGRRLLRNVRHSLLK